MQFLTREEIRGLIAASGSFLLTTHINPDGDGLGSELALCRHLRRNGKRVRIINASPLPENYRFLDGEGMFETYSPAHHGAEAFDADVLFFLDMNDAHRVGGMREAALASRARKIVIDHHLRPKDFADGYLIDEEACATGEIMHDILAAGLPEPLPAEIAVGLYIAIMTDTGSFRFARTTPRVHRIAASLLEAGVDPPSIYRAIYDEYPMRRTQLLGRVLAGIRPLCGGRATISSLPREVFAATGTSEEDTENMVNFGLAIRDAVATAFCVEMEECVKVSFRSVEDIDVSAAARSFGGGGHRNAAGARLYGMSLGEAEARVAESLCRAVGAPAADHTN